LTNIHKILTRLQKQTKKHKKTHLGPGLRSGRLRSGPDQMNQVKKSKTKKHTKTQKQKRARP